MIDGFAELVKRLNDPANTKDAYDLFENECTEEFRNDFYKIADPDSPEPFRNVMHKLGFKDY